MAKPVKKTTVRKKRTERKILNAVRLISRLPSTIQS